MRLFKAASRLAPLLALAACATGPQARVVRAQFGCDDGRKLQVAFNLDEGLATVRLTRKVSVVLTRTGEGLGRDYSGAGYALHGVGDLVTFTGPSGPPVRCLETH